MRNVFQSLIQFLIRHIILFLIVIVILVAGKAIFSEIRESRSLMASLPALEKVEKNFLAYRANLSNEVAKRANGFRTASVASMDARIAAITLKIDALSNQKKSSYFSISLLNPEQITSGLMARLEIELLSQELAYLKQGKIIAFSGLNYQNSRQKLVQLRLAHVVVYRTLWENQLSRKKLRDANRVKVNVYGTSAYNQMKILEIDHDRLLVDNVVASKNYLNQAIIVGRVTKMSELASFEINADRGVPELQQLQQHIADIKLLMSKNWIAKASAPVMDVVPTAALIVLMAFLTPVGIKAFFYFFLAPLAGRLRAISIDGDASDGVDMLFRSNVPGIDVRTISSISQSVLIDKGDELLIHPEFIQSSSISSKKNTKWLLDWSCPFTSMAAGLVAMTRVRAEQPESVVISATDDPLSEIALLSLPPGAAIVFQPRALVGVIHRKDVPLTITRHWRLGSLHAWLTLQLRYLVFRGPVTLIVKGCRGVRIEAAGSGRSISQSATLGFSANIAYSTMRSETFFPYLMSKQALFNDRFEGKSGFYVYEETPRSGKKSGLLARGFEGLADAVLKVFGI